MLILQQTDVNSSTSTQPFLGDNSQTPVQLKVHPGGVSRHLATVTPLVEPEATAQDKADVEPEPQQAQVQEIVSPAEEPAPPEGKSQQASAPAENPSDAGGEKGKIAANTKQTDLVDKSRKDAVHPKQTEAQTLTPKKLAVDSPRAHFHKQLPQTAQLVSLQPKQFHADGTVSASSNQELHQQLRQKSLKTDVTPKKFIETSDTLKVNQQPLNASERTKLKQANKEPLQPKIIAANPIEWLGNNIDARKRQLLELVARVVKKIPGYKELVLILGKDPITGQAVKRNQDKVIRAVLGLVPGGDAIYDKLIASGALKRVSKWFKAEVVKLNLTYDGVKQLFEQALNTLDPGDLLDLNKASEEVKQVFAPTINRVKNFAKNCRNKIMEFVFEGSLGKAGSKGADVLKTLKNTYGAIFSNPGVFMSNLFKALKNGFTNFSNNFLKLHLPKGFNHWLLGILGGRLAIPQQLNLQAFVTIGLQVLGISYDSLRPSLASAVGEKQLTRVEKIVKTTQSNSKIPQSLQLLQKIINRGIVGAWEDVKNNFQGLNQQKDEIIKRIKDIAFQQIIAIAIPKLIAMFTPVGALVEAAMAIYNSIMFFIERFQEITELATAVLKSLNDIALGKVGAAAGYIENAMGRSVPIILGFLSKLFRIDGIVKRVEEVIKTVQKPVKAAIDRLVNFLAVKINSFLKIIGKKQPPSTTDKPTESKTSPTNTGKPHRSSTQEPHKTGTTAVADFYTDHAFTMSGEKHHLIAKYKKGSLTLLIASDPELLIPALTEAIKELQAPNSPFSEKDKKECLEILKGAKSAADNLEYDVENDLNKITAQYRTGNNQQAIQRAVEQETKSRLASIANQIRNLSRFGITALDRIEALKKYYKTPPKERYLPIPNGITPSDFIRSNLYDRWQSVRDNFYNKKQPEVIQQIKRVQAMPDSFMRNKAWEQLKKKGLVENKFIGKIDDYKPNIIAYEVDHKVPLARLWNYSNQFNNNIAGHDTSDAERDRPMSDDTNLEVVTKEYNGSKSSGGVEYFIYVGSNFTSRKADNGIIGALRFKGKPFLDAAGNPLL